MNLCFGLVECSANAVHSQALPPPPRTQLAADQGTMSGRLPRTSVGSSVPCQTSGRSRQGGQEFMGQVWAMWLSGSRGGSLRLMDCSLLHACLMVWYRQGKYTPFYYIQCPECILTSARMCVYIPGRGSAISQSKEVANVTSLRSFLLRAMQIAGVLGTLALFVYQPDVCKPTLCTCVCLMGPVAIIEASLWVTDHSEHWW